MKEQNKLDLKRSVHYWEFEFIADSFEMGFVEEEAYTI
jgi:hypothetical protein